PVWGWIALAAVTLVAGAVMLWKAIQATDTPMEEWLKHCIYGKYPKYTSQEEMEKLNDVAYAMTIEFNWKDPPILPFVRESYLDNYDSVHFDISLPGLGETSTIDCKLILIGRGRRTEVFHDTIKPKMIGNNPIDPHVATIGPYTPGPVVKLDYAWYIPPSIRGGHYIGKLQVNDNIYSSAILEFQYFPDTKTMPNFVLPKAADKQIMIVED
ncbi:MAG: hypothetical protein LBF16_13970, partial [Pseudomonadales bacterium]|nr:hypothetical protein [Pseudomonadales bacterium]